MDNLELWYRANAKHKAVSGQPPVSFKANGKPLADWRIHGRTSENLFDFDAFVSSTAKTVKGGTMSVQGQSITLTASETDCFTYPYSGNQSGVYKIPVLPNTKYVLSWEADNNKAGRIYAFLNGSLSGARTALQTEKSIKFTTQDDTTYATIRFGVNSEGDSITYSNIQLNESSTVLPYEPYGGVGERTANIAPPLSDWDIGYIDYSTGNVITDANIDTFMERTSGFIEIISDYICFSKTGGFPLGTNGAWVAIGFYGENKTFISRPTNTTGEAVCVVVPNNAKFCRLAFRTYGETANVMANGGNTVLPYEPYGYKIPVTCGGETTNIYIGDEQLGDGDSVSYADTGVKIPTVKGTNTLSIGTAVQPSSVAITTPGAIPRGLRKYLQYKYDIAKE